MLEHVTGTDLLGIGASSRRQALLAPWRCQSRACRHAVRAKQMGPEPPPSRRSKPDWVRILEEDAEVDEDVAELLRGLDGDPDKINTRMQEILSQPPRSFGSQGASTSGRDATSNGNGRGAGGTFAGGLISEGPQGSEEAPIVTFRKVDPFELWLWLDFAQPLSERERELLESVLQAWFVVGKMGGYNSQNMQVYFNGDEDHSHFEYSRSQLEETLPALLHEMGEVQWRGAKARVSIDMGTADEVALDVLLNSLAGFSRDVAGLRRIALGGEDGVWPLPQDKRRAAAGTPGSVPKVGMNPMRLPEGIDDDLDLLDQIGALQEAEAAGQLRRESSTVPEEFDPQAMGLYGEEEFRDALGRGGDSGSGSSGGTSSRRCGSS